MAFSSIFPNIRRPAHTALPAQPDQLSDLRFALEVMPGSRKYVFTDAARAEILAKLYAAFFGPYSHFFLPQGENAVPKGVLLSEHQASVNFSGVGKEQPVVPGRSCSHVFQKGDCCFRCKDCSLDDSCVLCARCFHATDHSDHSVTFFIAQQPGGTCDCGDEEVWRLPIPCPYHPPGPPEELADVFKAGPRVASRPLPRDIPPVQHYPLRVPIPDDLRATMHRTIGFALDYILDMMDYSPDEPCPPHAENELRNQPTADPMTKDQYCVIVWNDDKHCFDELVKMLCDLTNRTREEALAVIRRVDDIGREIVEMNSNVPRLYEMAMTMAQIDLGVTIRRAYDTFCEQVVAVLIEWLADLTKVRVGTDVLVIREVIAAELLFHRRKEMGYPINIRSPLYINDPSPPRVDALFLYHTRLWKRPRLYMKEVYSSVVSLSRNHKLAIAGHFANVYHRIIDSYLLIDRDAETSIKYFALQLFTTPSVAGHIVKNHNLITRLLNIICSFFTNQIADKRIHYPPSLSVSTGAFSSNSYSSVTPPSSSLSNNAPAPFVSVAAAIAATGPLDVESFPFKSKRFMPVFSDLRYLCHTAPVQYMIANNREYIVQFAKACQLFMCVNPNKRAVASHVEYETDAWISVFNVTLSLSRVIKVFGEAFVKAGEAPPTGLVGVSGTGGVTGVAGSGTGMLVSAIQHVLHAILMVVTLAEDRLDKKKFGQITFHRVLFGPSSSSGSGDERKKEYSVVKFDVLDGWVSFHHSLHWLLAELLKHVQLLTGEKLGVVGYEDLKSVVLHHANQQAMLSVADFPLRVLAMVAQIRTGLWVRNGFGIRGQLLHYRDYMLRELCYDQDLYVLQTALVILDPDTVLVSILDRFGLLAYFSGSFVHPIFEPQQLSSMVEEVLYVLVALLSEDGNAVRLSVKDAVRREIVHALAMGPCTFSDLVKRVAERMVDDVCFENVLVEVAKFRPPEGPTESGVYELREEVYEEVNPFFYHYTRNRREEVENVLKTRMRKKMGLESKPSANANGKEWEKEPVIMPKRFGQTVRNGPAGTVSLSDGPFADLTKVFETEVLMQIMFYALHNVLVLTDSSGTSPPSAEAILDQALHLVMLGLVERQESFSRLAAERTFCEGTRRTLVEVLCALEHHEKYRPYHSRVKWVLDRMLNWAGEEIGRRRIVVEGGKKEESPEDARKRAAKARQEAIMRQMKAQQASFKDKFEGVDLESDEDEMMEDADGMEGVKEENLSFGTCIVCQEDLNASRGFGALGLVQPSRLLRKQPDVLPTHLAEIVQMGSSLDRAPPPAPIRFPPTQQEIREAKATAAQNFDGYPSSYTRFGLYSSVCSHMMHLECFQVYSVSIRQRHRAQATRNHPENIPRKEYICPLCKSLGNVILPVINSPKVEVNNMPFGDWIRAAGIGILKSRPDPLLDALQSRTGTGEFVFWSAQDPGYAVALRNPERWGDVDTAKMLDTVMVVAKAFSQQTRHLRERPEPEAGERGAGIYLPEELVGYTIAGVEVAQRGVSADRDGAGLLVDHLTEAQTRMVRGLLVCLSRLAAMHFKGRPDEGRDAIRQAIVKRMLPEWSRITLTSFSYPLLLRDPFTLLVETAAIAPEIIRHILTLTYYACLARSVIGLVYILTKLRHYPMPQMNKRVHEDIFGDVHMFFSSVVRHSPLFEHSANLAFEMWGVARVEKLLYQFTLPFLRRAAVLCRSILPSEFPTPPSGRSNACEYKRLLDMLGIPALCDLPKHDVLQNALSGWCAHYGHSQAATQVHCGVPLEYPSIYRLAKLPLVLDNLFGLHDKALTCQRCNTVPMDAAICLICGVTCCFQSHCCTDVDYNERGECNMHMRECGGMIGVYFLVKRSSLLYLSAGNGTFAWSPYLDVNGEVDMGIRRQFLHSARWEDIRKTWINHSIPTVVARKLEATIDPGGWETF